MQPGRLLPFAFLCFLTACAHAQRANSADALKKAADTFHQRIRWKDFRSAAELIVPDRREKFIEAREQMNDERDLTISDYDLEEEELAEDGKSGKVVSRIAWMRLPSLSEKTETVRSYFYLHNGAWLLGRMDRGPFADVLGSEYTPPAPAATPEPAK
ncbi:MAG: hypothetical protein ACJ790_22885 [Myxococcaceae bacterium]